MIDRSLICRMLAFLSLTISIQLPVYAQLSRSEITGSLARKVERSLDKVEGADISYDVLQTSDGARLRTIFSKPSGSPGKVPVIYFVQWLSCSTVELADDDGWTQMLTHLIGKSGYAMMRTEKAGVGDSEGQKCSELDYLTEVQHHRESLAALMKRDDIDASRVFVFGGSMGANQAPLIAGNVDIAGVIVWGGGARTWFERMLGFDRRSLEFTADDPAEVNSKMKLRARFHHDYLIEKHIPGEIMAKKPELAGVWEDMIGTDDTNHYGRPFAFHFQAQDQNWEEAWSKINAPVLVLYGEYDWTDNSESHQRIADLVNYANPGQAIFKILKGVDHNLSRYSSPKAAFEESGGSKVGQEAAIEIETWMRSIVTISAKQSHR